MCGDDAQLSTGSEVVTLGSLNDIVVTLSSLACVVVTLAAPILVW